MGSFHDTFAVKMFVVMRLALRPAKGTVSLSGMEHGSCPEHYE